MRRRITAEKLAEQLRLPTSRCRRMAAQCGGVGNIERVHHAAAVVAQEPPFARHLDGWTGPWNFRDPAGMRDDLLTAGFDRAECRLVPRPVVPEVPAEWFRTIVLGAHLAQLPPGLRDLFVKAPQVDLVSN